MKQAEFTKAVAGLPFEKTAYFETVGSTNDIVAEWARAGATGLCVAAADEQTRGRGRAGRRWSTPPGSALAFSLLLEIGPSFEAAYLGRISGLAAVAVCEALEGLYKLEPQIKWPNDVLLLGKKICGILPEAHWSGDRLHALILGVGINVASNSVPPLEAVNFPAGCVEEALGHPIHSGELLRAILERLLANRATVNGAEFLAAWEARLAYKGKPVTVEQGAENSKVVEVLGLAKDGGLKVRAANGETQVFQVGEIHLRPAV